MKRFLIVCITLGLALSLATPVLASSAHPVKNSGTFSLVGQIAELDSLTDTVTVLVRNGNRLAKASIGYELAILTSGTTRFLLNDGETTTKITFSDLKVGDQVSVLGKLMNDEWRATRITVDLKAPCP